MFASISPDASSSLGYLPKDPFYIHQKRHCHILEFIFVNEVRPEAIEICLCVHRGFTLSKNKPK